MYLCHSVYWENIFIIQAESGRKYRPVKINHESVISTNILCCTCSSQKVSQFKTSKYCKSDANIE